MLRLVAERDSSAMGELYDRHGGLLYATILRIAGEPAEAQDILHDAFVQIGRKSGGYDPAGGRPVGWLVTLVRNLALDRVRVAKRRRELLATALEPEPQVVSGDAVVDRKDDAHYWANAVAGLPAPQREALELAFFAGYTQEEISERLQQPLGTIKARIRRGLLKLRDSIEAAP